MAVPTPDTARKGTDGVAGSRPYIPAVPILVISLAIIVGMCYWASQYHTHRYEDGFSHGYNAGKCQGQQDAIKAGYRAYMKAHSLDLKATFADGNSCDHVMVTHGKVVKTTDGHTVVTTCQQAQILPPDAKHATPYTKGVKCKVVDTSTNEVSVGQPIGGG